MKQFLFAFVLFASACNNQPKPTADHLSKKDSSSFTLIVPEKWNTEHISFPIPFAPSIHYSGTENLRFAPGFENTSSSEHWSYAFLWCLNGSKTINADTLSTHLTTYYRGLVSENIKNMTTEQKESIVAEIKSDAAPDAFSGIVKMIDYTDIMKPNITLNMKAVIRKCSEHTAVLIRLSPQPFNAEVWKQLNVIDSSFKCRE